MNKAGIPAGSKTIADFSLHPVILNSEKLMLNHLKWTFIEEGTIGLLFDRHGFLKLYLSLSRSKDITNLFPQHIIKIFQSKYKGKSISVFSEDIPQNIRARILLSFPKVLEQETDFILKMLEKEKVKIRVSFIHISKKGNITANYSIRFASEKAVEYIAENIILKDYYGTWKEQRMKKFLKLYNEFKGVKLSPSQRNEILEIRNQYTHIPLKWALEKARSLFPSVKWLYKDEYIDKLWKRRER